jgi:hypothetical protein
MPSIGLFIITTDRRTDGQTDRYSIMSLPILCWLIDGGGDDGGTGDPSVSLPHSRLSSRPSGAFLTNSPFLSFFLTHTHTLSLSFSLSLVTSSLWLSPLAPLASLPYPTCIFTPSFNYRTSQNSKRTNTPSFSSSASKAARIRYLSAMYN